MGVMFGVIDMRAHRNNGRDSASLSHTVAEEAGQSAIAGKVAGTADTVHQLGTGYMRGVYMTVNIHFQSGIHGYYTDAAGYFAVIGNFLRTEDDLLAVFFNIGMEAFQSIR